MEAEGPGAGEEKEGDQEGAEQQPQPEEGGGEDEGGQEMPADHRTGGEEEDQQKEGGEQEPDAQGARCVCVWVGCCMSSCLI